MVDPNDPYNLQRFAKAQEGIFDQARKELRGEQKRSHWMWFVFPQLAGLGHSSTAIKYGISSRREAEAYLNHPLLGPRLRECTQLVTLIQGRSIEQIFGSPDDLKFRSSMTLFAIATSDNQIFKEALQKYFAGELDQLTIERLGFAKLRLADLT